MRHYHPFHIHHWIWLAVLAVIGPLAVRIVLSFLRARIAKDGIRKSFAALFWGEKLIERINPQDDEEKKKYWEPDYWLPYLIGLFEVSSFAIMMGINKPNYIAAWIGLKTIAQWKSWLDDRVIFNLFLLGQALVLVIAFFAMKLAF